jgi:hypothetical protein
MYISGSQLEGLGLVVSILSQNFLSGDELVQRRFCKPSARGDGHHLSKLYFAAMTWSDLVGRTGLREVVPIPFWQLSSSLTRNVHTLQ